MSRVSPERIVFSTAKPINSHGDFVLYWMIAARRTRYNFGLQRAAELGQELRKPLMVLEALRCDYPYASLRLHRFILDGMRDTKKAFLGSPALYYPYVEQTEGEGKGLVEALGARACVVVTDYFPCFFLPRMVAVAADRLRVRCEVVDSNGIVPLRAHKKVFTTAFSFRRFLQHHIRDALDLTPFEDALYLCSSLPKCSPVSPQLTSRWPPASEQLLQANSSTLSRLPIDQGVSESPLRGGQEAARKVLALFVKKKLAAYHCEKNHPDYDATSGLSPYLHFGHISVHEVFAAIVEKEGWNKERLISKPTGARQGRWRMREGPEAFLDQLITWREIGFNMCHLNTRYDCFDSLPQWARATLMRHEKDPRPYQYSLEEFENAATHDPVWNATQRQLVLEGRLHSYLRMLWGKKILAWSASPQEALSIMIALNNKYALDGRDPNSYSGIFWVLGRYDRPWGPERPIFGTIRYMSAKRTIHKVRMDEYLKRYGSSNTR